MNKQDQPQATYDSFNASYFDLFSVSLDLLDLEPVAPFSVTLDQRILVDALTAIGASLSNRSTLPILANVKLEATQDGLYLHTTNLESYSIYRIPASVVSMSPGSCTVNYKELLALVKPLKHQVLKLSMQEKTLSIEASGFTAPLSTMDASEYPAIPSVNEKTRIPLQTVTLPVATLRKLVNLTWYAASEDLSRPVFTAICCNLTKDVLELVAADAFRMSIAREKVVGSGSWDFSLLIPASDLHKIIGKLPKQGEVTISTESSVHALLTCGDLTVYMRLIEGTYPNIERVIPQSSELTAVIDNPQFKMALQSVKGIVQDSSNITRLHLNGALEVKATRDGMDKPMSVHVDAATSGQEMDILLNWKYINDVLAVNPGKEIQMGFNLPNKAGEVSGKPVRVTFPEVPGFVGVLMPMHNSR